MSELSQYDNLLRTERFRLGKLQKIREGGWKGGRLPFGYELKESQLSVHPEEHVWVVKIHEWYRDGMTAEEIKDELLKNGVMTRRDKPVWSLGSINALLTNTHYDGYWYYTDKKSEQTVRVSCPRICSSELIQGVKQSWEKRRYKSSGTQRSKTGVTKYIYLLSKMMKCGSCGSVYYGNYREGRTSNYYHCGQKTNKYRDKHTDKMVVCGSKRNVRIDTTERVVWDLVKEVLKTSHLYKQTIKDGVFGNQESHDEAQKRRTKNQKTIDNYQKEVQKITDAIVNLTTESIMSPEGRDVKSVIKKLEKSRNDKEAEIQRLTDDLQNTESQGRWVDWLKVWKERVDDVDALSKEEKHQFLKGIVSEVVVTETDTQSHRLDVIFQYPWVGDKLVHLDSDDKSKGYKILEGKKIKSKKADLLKKFTGLQKEATIV